jgi:biopolymer transport protein ExbB/TolQ
MHYKTLTKLEIAEVQLFHSVELYLTGDRLVSAITLAGAAEEILGKLVKRKGSANALDEKVETLCKMFEFVFKEPADPKKFSELRNNARNELKHIGNSEAIELNMEDEAVKLLNRAIKNYKKLKPGYYPLFRDFEKERLRRHKQQAEIT